MRTPDMYERLFVGMNSENEKLPIVNRVNPRYFELSEWDLAYKLGEDTRDKTLPIEGTDYFYNTVNEKFGSSFTLYKKLPDYDMPQSFVANFFSYSSDQKFPLYYSFGKILRDNTILFGKQFLPPREPTIGCYIYTYNFDFAGFEVTEEDFKFNDSMVELVYLAIARRAIEAND